MRHLFTSDPEDIAWVQSTHLGPLIPAFESFEMFGNEDAPDKIILYREADPTIFATPLAVFNFGDPS